MKTIINLLLLISLSISIKAQQLDEKEAPIKVERVDFEGNMHQVSNRNEIILISIN